MPYKTPHIIGIFYAEIGAHKSAKSNFCIFCFVLLLVCHIRMLVLNKNAEKKPIVAICFEFEENRWFVWTTTAILSLSSISLK